MGRPDKRQKQQRMARAALDAALSRGRFAEAADALFRVEAEQREAALAAVRAGMASDIAAAFARRDAAAVLAWLSRLEREPRLWGDDDTAAPLRWMCLAAAVQSKHWPRAKLLFEALRPRLAEGPVRSGLALLIAHEGAPIEELVSVLDDDDDAARLGYEAARPRVDYPPPETAAQAVAHCCACFGCEPWPRFRGVVQRWLTAAPEPVRDEIRRTAVQLAQRELWLSCEQAPEKALEVARFCVELAASIRSGDGPGLDLAWCLRAMAAVMGRPLKERSTVEAMVGVVEAALRRADLAAQVDLLLSGAAFEGAALEAAPRLFRSALAVHPTPRLLLGAVRVLAAGARQSDPPKPPASLDWLAAGCEAVLAQPQQLALALEELAAGPDATRDLLAWLPVPLAARLVDEVFPCAVEPVREALAGASVALVERMKAPPVARDPSRMDMHAVRALLEVVDPGLAELPDEVLRNILRSPEARAMLYALPQQVDWSAPLPAWAHDDFQRIAVDVLPYRTELLEAALSFQPKPAACRALVAAFWSRRDTLVSRFRALCEALEEGLPRAAQWLEKQLLADIQPTTLDFARTLWTAERIRMPRRIRNKLSRGLLEAAERDTTQLDRPEVREALRLARWRVQPKPKRATKAQGKPAASHKRGKKSPASRSRPARRHAPLFEGEAGR